MNIDRIIMALAGSGVLISLLLTNLHSTGWLWLTAFVGLNLLQASITGFCPAVKVLQRLGVRPGKAFT